MNIYNTNEDLLQDNVNTSDVLIYQDYPDYGGDWNLRGWKTINGYLNEARELTTCIMKNRHDYRWFVTLNFTNTYEETEHKRVWKHITDSLRKSKIEAIAVREPSRSNKIHYHIIVCDHKEYKTIDGVRELFDSVFPDYYKTPRQYRLHVEQIVDVYNVALYITKGKFKSQPDKHWKKRLLFSKDFNLDKVVKIGNFWKTKRKDIWKAVVRAGKKYGEEQKAIEAAITSEIRQEAVLLHNITGMYNPREIEKMLALAELRKLTPSYGTIRPEESLT